MATQTDKLKIRLIQSSEDFADDAFNKVIEDIDNKVVGVSHLTSGAHWSVWEKSTDYVVGDVVRTPYLKSNQYMECVVAGTSSTTSPTNNIQGSNVTDNTVTWTIKTLGGASDSIVSFWKGNTQYYKGSLVVYNNKLYRSYFTHTSSTFSNDKANWFEVQSSINVWIANAYYAVGDTVVYEGNVYQCNTENTDATFTVDNWDLLNSYGIVKDWSASTKYFKDQLVSYDGAIYKVKSSYTSGNFFSDTNLTLVSSTIPTWDSDTYYPVGIIVQNGNVMYKCTSAHTSSNAFNTDLSNWEIFHTPNAFVRDWQANTEYKTGQLVVVNGNLYRRTSDGYDTTWSTGFWELVTNAITDWSANTYYKRGQYVNYNGALYKCITSNNDATFTIAKWEKVSGGSLANWSDGVDYVVNDTVIYADKLYQCTTAHTSTTFSADEANWKEISSYTVHIDDWVASTAYKAGDLVAYDAQIYRCKVSHTSSSDFSTDDTKWEILSPTINIIKDWEVSTAYTLGQFVTHNNVLYKCNTAHTSDSTSFDTDIAKWDKIGSSIDQWKANTSYRINDLVIYANKLYSCDINHTSANAIDLSKWTLIGDEGINDWESSKAYKAGQLVLHNNVLYRIHDNHTSSAQITSDDAHLDFVWSNIRPWEPNTYYKQGSIVYNGGCIYKCNNSHTSGSSFTGTVVFDGSSGIFNYSYQTSPAVSNNTGVLDLGSICQVYKIYFEMHVDKHKWRKLDMYISDDNSTYNLFTTFTSPYTGNKIEKHTVYPQSPTSGRYVKLVASDFIHVGDTPRSFSINPIRVYTSNNNWELISGLSSWKPSIEYSKGDLVIYNSSIYRCISSNSDNTFVPSSWEETTAFPIWNTGKDYSIGNIVLYNDRIYRCITAHTSRSFSSDRNNWVEISSTSLQNWQASITYPVDSIVLYDNTTGIPHWAGNTSYVLNDKVVYDGRIYECSVANSDSDFTASNWHQIATAQVNIYKCLTENNDADFTPSKWLAISSIGLASIEDIEAMF